MTEEPSSLTDRITMRQLLIGAAALAIIGLFLVFGADSDGDESDSTAETTDSSSVEDDDNDASSNQETEPTSGSTQTTGTDAPTDEPAPLPSGMERPGPTAAPEPSTVDESSPSEIALAALTAAYSMDTTTDDSPDDALSRVEPWLDAPFDDDAYDLEDLGDFVEEEWDTWADHDGYASINVIQDVISNDAVTPEERGDTATEAMRKIAVGYTPLGRDGWNGQAVTDHTWYVTMARPSKSDAWRIVEMRRPEFAPTIAPTAFPTPSSSSS